MIDIQEQADDEIVVVRASGLISRGEIEAAEAQLERLIEERGSLRLYVDLVGLDGFEPAGLWEEVKFDLRNHDRISRVAFIVNSAGERWAGKIGGMLMARESHEFEVGDEEHAVLWLRGFTTDA